MKSLPKMRIARPTTSIQNIQTMYMRGLGLQVIGKFQNHDGYDGVMLGIEGQPYHLEFTFCSKASTFEKPHIENLLIFYFPNIAEWKTTCENMLLAGFTAVTSENPYWDKFGKSFEDFDGNRVVIQNQECNL